MTIQKYFNGILRIIYINVVLKKFIHVYKFTNLIVKFLHAISAINVSKILLINAL